MEIFKPGNYYYYFLFANNPIISDYYFYRSIGFLDDSTINPHFNFKPKKEEGSNKYLGE